MTTLRNAIALATLVASSAGAQGIKVGPNVHVTGDASDATFWEVSACANPNDAKEIVAVPVLSDPVVSTPRPHHVWDIGSTAYRSTDGGVTWKRIMYQKVSQDP